MKESKPEKSELPERYGIPTRDNGAGVEVIDIGPLLVGALLEIYTAEELKAGMTELVGRNWLALPAWEWGQIIEDKGLMEYDESLSQTFDPFSMEFWAHIMDDDAPKNESVYNAIVRLLGPPKSAPKHQKLLFRLKKFVKQVMKERLW